MNQEHPWLHSREKFDRVILPKLQRDGLRIGREAKLGNTDAANVVKYYTLLYRSFDPLTLIQIEEAITRYESKPSPSPNKSPHQELVHPVPDQNQQRE